MILKAVALLCLVGLVLSVKRYDNFKVYNVMPTSDVQVQLLEDLKEESYEFWTEPLAVGNNARVMVAPAQMTQFEDYANRAGMVATVSIENVQTLIDTQNIPAKIDRSATLGSFNWTQYHTLEDIHSWLDELAVLYPGVVTNVTIGTSFEGRALKGVVIDLQAGNRVGTPLVGVIEGGIHAREWISPATVTWIIKEFLTTDDPELRIMAESFIWHIFPVANPDGYVYTFTGDRMWRKNRNPTNFANCTSGSNDLGIGIDLNRNFDYLWMTVGASGQPCSTTYAGPTPASERETQAISSYVRTLQGSGNLLYYLAFHSYSQMILIPFSHMTASQASAASNFADLFLIASKGVDKMRADHGTNYTFGTSRDILYQVSGSSFDWAKGAAGVPISMLFELRDLGTFGFLLPAEQIIPNNEEIIDCLIEMDKTTRLLNYYSGSGRVFASFVSMALSLMLMILLR